MPKQKCRSCDGTGKVKLLKSWFLIDGCRVVECWMCDGTGHSNEPDVFNGWRLRYPSLGNFARSDNPRLEP